MFDYDVCIIGGGVLGCMAARELMRSRVKAVLIEKESDVCTGITRANSAIVYAGYDNQPGTLKSELCVRANAGFETLCRELGVRMKRCGSLMICFGPRGAKVLQKKWEQGKANGVPGLRILEREEILEMEPHLNPDVYQALYAPTVGTVNPWELGIAAYENARANGCEIRLNTRVTDIRRLTGGFEVRLNGEKTIRTRGILNCAGLYADDVREMVFPPKVRIFPGKADYLVFDVRMQGYIRHVIFEEPEEKGKGLTLIPTVAGNILAGPSELPGDGKEVFGTTAEGLDFLREKCAEVVPGLPMGQVIRDFGAIRPNPFDVEPDKEGGYRPGKRSIHSFVIDQPEECPGMVSLIGIKTPGLTCSAELAGYTAGLLSRALGGWENNPDFCPVRTAPVRTAELTPEEWQEKIRENPAYGRIVCLCEKVTEGEIREAIRRGARTVDGVKRRCGCGMGRCQGGRCQPEIRRLLAEMTGSPEENRETEGAER